MNVPKNIDDDDLLGRAVFSSRSAKRATKGKIDFRIFFHEKSDYLSVDRFGFCSEKELTNIQDKNAELRKRSFYGWAKIKTIIARRNKRIIQATPTEYNPYHADINLPENIEKG